MGQDFLQSGKRLLRNTALCRLYRTYSEKRAYRKRIQERRPVRPPHRVKREIIRQYALRFRLPVFIETGRYLGGMVEAVKGVFEGVYSIELSSGLPIGGPRHGSKGHPRDSSPGRQWGCAEEPSGAPRQTVPILVRRPLLWWHHGAGR